MTGARLALGGLAAGVLALLSACGPSAAPSARRPNVVLIVIDTLRADRLPAYGHAQDTAPFLTRFASRAVVFERALSPSSWTAPATVSLLTSLYPFQHGVHVASLAPRRGAIEVMRIPDAVAPLAEVLAAAGYRTFGISDNQNVTREAGFARGFERFVTMNYEAAPAVNATLERWRPVVQSGGPYFLYVHYMDPHMPYHDRAPWYAEFRRASREPDPERRELLARYDSEIRFVDTALAEVMTRWGWADDPHTVVVVTSDHGEEFGEHGGWQHGQSVYGELVNVPLLVRAPGRGRAGRRVAARVSLVDVLPTILELTGVPAPPRHAGRSLVPLIDADGAGAGTEPPLFAHLVHPGTARGTGSGAFQVHAIVAGDLKFLDYDDRPDQLFDLRRDPGERHDLARVRPDAAAALAARLAEELRVAPRFEPGRGYVPLSPKQRQKLRALGYLDERGD